MYRWNKGDKAVKDFVKFGAAMIYSGDIDPQFWIIRDYYKRNKVDENTALWLSFLYLTFYHLGSASIAWQLYPQPEMIKVNKWDRSLVFFKQRRLFRGNTFALKHIDELLRITKGDLKKWMDNAVGDGGVDGWTRVREAYGALPYTGPWSSYKWCDMMKFIHKYPITAPDIGNKPGATAGPIAGLATLSGLPREKCASDLRIYQDLYVLVVEDFGMPVMGVDHLESVLCDWQSVTNGRYYHGHDIDRDMVQLYAYPENEVSKQLFKARARIFDHRHLGEKDSGFLGGWDEVRKGLKPVYRQTGEIVNVYEDVKKVTLL